MLELKSIPKQASVRPCPSTISDLPPEILDLTLRHVYRAGHDRIDSIAPSSRTSRQFRASALPLLFESVSCVIREHKSHRAHPSFPHLASQPHLLRHAKSLSFRRPLVLQVTESGDQVGRNHSMDLAHLEHALQHMPQLRRIRLRCTLETAIQVLHFFRNRTEIVIIADHVYRSTSTDLNELLYRFFQLLRGHTVALGKVWVPSPLSLSQDATGAKPRTRLLAIDLAADTVPHGNVSEDPNGDRASPTIPIPLCHLSELWLDSFQSSKLRVSLTQMLQAIQWSQLRRLRLYGPHLVRQLQDVIAKLQGLEDLHLETSKPIVLHSNCPYNRPRIWSDVNYPFFDLEFALLPNLKTLEIIGICNHVPIKNLAGASLRALKLHKIDIRSSVVSSESQRSPPDLIMLAKIAPLIERLELDVGYVENLWHPTAIPGVEVDLEQYRFLAALANFKCLKIVRLFPPYVVKDHLHSPLPYGFRQPLSDEQAIRMFNYIRSQCSKLELLSISVSALRMMDEMDFSPMNWEVRPWGHRTVLTTRQLGKDYELRQVWVGERRLTMETKRQAYWKKHIPDPEGWLLTRPYLPGRCHQSSGMTGH